MPWSVRIEDERGNTLTDDVVVEFRMLEDLPPNSVLLKGIDRFQDTTFNNLQLKLFLREWEILGSQLATREETLIWESVRAYTMRCLKEPHTYLKFIGD